MRNAAALFLFITLNRQVPERLNGNELPLMAKTANRGMSLATHEFALQIDNIASS